MPAAGRHLGDVQAVQGGNQPRPLGGTQLACAQLPAAGGAHRQRDVTVEVGSPAPAGRNTAALTAAT